MFDSQQQLCPPLFAPQVSSRSHAETVAAHLSQVLGLQVFDHWRDQPLPRASMDPLSLSAQPWVRCTSRVGLAPKIHPQLEYHPAPMLHVPMLGSASMVIVAWKPSELIRHMHQK